MVTLIHGDTLALLRGELGFRHPTTGVLLQADACVTDPPYGIDFAGNRRTWDSFGITSAVAARPGHAFERWCELWSRPLLTDVLRPGAHIVAFSSERMIHRLASGLEDAGFDIVGGLAWIYLTGQAKNSGYTLRPAYEPIALGRKLSGRNLIDIFIQDGRGLLHTKQMKIAEGYHPVNVMSGEDPSIDPDLPNYFFCPKATRKDKDYGCEDLPIKVLEIGSLRPLNFRCTECDHVERRMARVKNFPCPVCQVGVVSKPTGAEAVNYGRNPHATVKPIALMRRIIRLTTKPGHTVIDPFMGSGTTGIAAVLEGRDFIGIDQEAEFCNIAHHRIARACLEVGAAEDAMALKSAAEGRWPPND